MAKTVLDAVNETLKRVGMISGDAGELTTLTDSGRQHSIDVTVQIWNELINDLYAASNVPLPQESATGNITLVDGTREYTLPADLEQIRWPLINQTEGHRIDLYPGDFEQMRIDQLIPANFTGRPIWAAINPTNGKLRMNTVVDSDDDGEVYQILYDKRLSFTAAADTFPFSDSVVDSLVPAAAQVYDRNEKSKFDDALFRSSFGRAARFLSKRQQGTKW